VPLHHVKRIGRRLGGTVNDVLLTALSGALRRYLHDHQVPVDGAGLRAVVPVNTRTAGEVADLTNDIGLVFLSLPTSTEDPIDSLAQVRRRMDRLKDSLEPAVTKGLLLALGTAPVGLQNALFDVLGSKASALVTNVIGPRERRYLAGAPLDSLMFWVPQSGGVGLGISILSYAGQVRIGVLADRHVVPDPAAIVAAFQAELGRLLAIAAGTEEPATVRGMIATLDRALEVLGGAPAPHGGLAGQNDGARATAPQPHEARARCQGVTRTGERCKRPPSPGSSYCHLHA
jgi:WS/DGAT/MGAT family acyltransferase